MPNLDAANIAYTMTMIMADALLIGPILIGAASRLYSDAFVDGARHHHMTAVSVAEAQGESQTENAEAISRAAGLKASVESSIRGMDGVFQSQRLTDALLDRLTPCLSRPERPHGRSGMLFERLAICLPGRRSTRGLSRPGFQRR